ncbi:hypothetical protein [Pseudomonas sp. C9]|jgi:hypothetical protein|nr:hypothetical protein [Pseudomonas sp. C9]
MTSDVVEILDATTVIDEAYREHVMRLDGDAPSTAQLPAWEALQ